MTTYEKLVEGATKIKLAPPKPKYIEPILMATAEEDYRIRHGRLSTSPSSLCILWFEKGEDDVTLHYLSLHPKMLDCKIANGSGHFISNGGSLKTLAVYSTYLATRAKEYFETKHDYIRETRNPVGSWSSHTAVSSLRKLSIEKGLLRHIESVQRQIDALVKCRFRESEVNNDLLVLGFRMLTTDLLSSYQTLNEGVLNILEHFFELSKVDANRAFDIYTTFTKETTRVIEFLRVAKHLERVTKLRVPTIKHAQTSLTKSLKEYIDDPYFEVNRNQYLAEKQTKNNKEASDGKEEDQSQDKKVESKKKKSHEKTRTLSQGEQLFGAKPQQGQAAGQAIPASSSGLILQTTGFNPFTSIGGFQSTSLAPVPEYPQQQQQVPPPVPMAASTNMVAPNTVLNSSVTMPVLNTTPNYQQQAPVSNIPPPSASSAFGYLPSQAGPTSQVQGSLSRAQTTDGVPNGNLKRSSTNPFALGSVQQKTASGTNPFTQTRFAANSGITTISFNTPSSRQQPSSEWKRASSNPFSSASPASAQNQSSVVTQYQLKPQPTAGGLENLPTIPIFPETKKVADQQRKEAIASQELQQQKTQNLLQQQQLQQQQQQLQLQQQLQQQQQQLQLQQQQQQQQQLQQQQLQQQQLQQQSPQRGISSAGSYNPFAQAQPSQNYSQIDGQSTQVPQSGASNVYTGPNLIG
ncbi:hypothetical protein HII13_003099 [Brettanomyces bruxellensis]|nr:hypothetical protein HII13_003099 [Brettanomyces bruxellensis]